MRFLQVVLAGAFAASALAQGTLQFTSVPRNIQAGQTVNLEWQGGDSSAPVTITLRQGESDDLNTIETITSSATGGTYEWTVPTTIASNSQYAFEIKQGGQTNFWGPVAIAGGTGTLSTSATSAASSAASSRASASSASARSTSSASASESSSSASASASASRSSASASSSSASASRSSSSSSSTSSESSTSAASAAAPSDTGNAAYNLKGNAALALGAAAAVAYIA